MIRSLSFLPLLLITYISSFSQVNLNNGLVAYYPFNGNANDASGNGNNAVFNNATLTSDRFGNPNSAYYFNGVDNYIQIPNSSSLVPQELSLCAIIKPLGFYTGPCYNSCIIDKGSPDYIPGDYSLRFTQAAYTGGDCNSFDTLHQNFVGYGYINNSAPLYTPYVTFNTQYCVVYTVSSDSLKLYVDGILKWKEKKTYSIGTNSQDLFLGRKNSAQYPFWFNGIMDEVRIYNRAINAQEVNALCSVTSDSTIINDYTEVLGFDICKNELKVADATKYNPGDTVLIIQMKGATIDQNNAAAFGNISNYNNSGNYEMNIVKQKNGNTLSLLNVLQRQYDIPAGKVQLIRVPYFKNITVDNTLTCLPWDGSKGGVLVLNVENTTTLNADIDVSGRGFHGGTSPNPNTTTLYCDYNDFYYPKGTAAAADKGESITNIGDGIAWGKGSPANGGGGGNGHNSGGGGGSNGGSGGFGGYQLDACGGSATDNRGLGGKALIYNNAVNKIFMGGGGGSGDTDNSGGSPMNGGNGGGIVIIKSPVLNAGNHKIIAKGGDASQCSLSPIDLCHDGSGGGGGAGTILLENTNLITNTNVDISGGKGGDLAIYSPPGATKIGPGGGGGAGIFWSNKNTLPANIIVNKTGGINGVIIANGNDPYGTTPGQDGSTLFNLKIPVDTILFKPNIDSVRIQDTAYCSFTAFGGLAYTGFAPINTWQWNFGDGTPTILGQRVVVHIYSLPGTYTVKLIVTDNNGCKDSISKPILINQLIIAKSPDTSICGGNAIQLFATGGTTYKWTPAASLNNPNINNPVATPLATTMYHVTVTNASGCSQIDSVRITVNNLPVISKSKDTGICNNASVQLFASGGNSYSWTPAATLNNANISNPVATPTATTIYYVKVTNAAGCSKSDSIKISTSPPPVITKSADTSICKNTSTQLLAGGGSTYLWSPASTLNNAGISNPVATPGAATIYYVIVTNAFGCSKTDSVKVGINPIAVIAESNDTLICNNASIRIFASGGSRYLWSPASSLNDPTSSSPLASPTTTTMYKVAIKDSYSCSYTDSVKVSVRSSAIFNVTPDGSTCVGSSKQLQASGGDSYTWAPANGLDNPNISNPLANPATSTVYTVTIHENTCNETAVLTTNVTVLPSADINASSSNDLTCSLGSSQLTVTGGTNYTWIPSTGLDNSNISNPIATPAGTTVYKVIGTGANGCSGSDTVTVKVNFNINALYLLPNSFTPNGDGLNDCFGVKYWGVVNDLDFSIYNRYGERIFHSTDPANCWDGTYKGKPQNANVFVYIVKAKTACGNIERKGTVALLK